ncbi:MAG: PQQ-dependent sugar dehydrogenase [Thermomicrobiales bacterium]
MTSRPALRAILALAAALAIMLTASVGVGRADPSAREAAPFDPATFTVGLTKVVDGLSKPVQMVDSGDGSGRSFVVEQGGAVRVFAKGALAAEPFLDIGARVTSGSEQGLLSIALHPDFAANGVFFIDYTDLAGNTQIERWALAKDAPDRADPASATTVLSVDQPFPNHNGGLLLFGPDGKLYIGLGDGGSGGDPNGNGQNPGTLLGSILRIDVDAAADGKPHGIPADNSFVGDAKACPEVWAYGLRNPWRFSFDRATGDLLIGDVGQGQYEEVDLNPAGKGGLDFGWNIMEGSHCYKAESCDESGLRKPIVDYSHDDGGCSVTGGYVYRAAAIPALQGVYLYADYCSGLLWGIGKDADGHRRASDPVKTDLSVSSFAEDGDGGLYVIDLKGAIYAIAAGS